SNDFLGRCRPRLLLRLDLADASPVLLAQRCLQPLPELRHHVEVRAKRVDDDRARDPLGNRRQHLEGEVPAPGVPDDPRPAAGRLVDHRRRVGHIRLDRERPLDGRRRQTALLVETLPEDAGQVRHERLHIARRDARPAVEEHGLRPLALVVPAVDVALGGRDDKRFHYALPRARSISRPRMRSPATRRPSGSNSLLTPPRRPPTRPAVSSEKERSTYMSWAYTAAAAGTSFARSTPGS